MLALVLSRWERGWIRTLCGGDGRSNGTKGFRCGCADTVAVIAICIDFALFVFCLFISYGVARAWSSGAAGVMGKNREELEFSGLVWMR